MYHILRKALAVAALVVVAVLAAAGCTHHSSSAQSVAQQLKANPALHQQLTSAEQQGLTRMETCYPNGKALFTSVMSGQASAMTAFQVAESFKGSNLTSVLDRCLPAGNGHPLKHAAHLFDTCFAAKVKPSIGTAISSAVQPYQAHPIKDRHVIYAATTLATSQATVRVAAACFAAIPQH